VGIRDRIRRLGRDIDPLRWDLTCPECGWRTLIYGDLPMDLMVIDWTMGAFGQPPSGTDKKVLELFNHEHPAEAFVEKRSGLPLSDPKVSGMSHMTTGSGD
jgi:hypothetical protein